MNNKVKVVTTIPPLADFSRQIGGSRVEVTNLLSPGASPHTFEPTPSEAMAAEEADLIVRIGGDVDHWVEGLLPEGIPVIEAAELEGIDLILEDDHLDNEGHPGRHVSPNPHIWLDPVYAKVICSAIAEKLSCIDQEGRKAYEENLARYQGELDSLHAKIENSLADLESRKYVSFHPAWIYFAYRYDLERIAVIMKSPGKEPSPRSLKEVVEEIENNGARMIFAEPQFSAKAAEVIASEAGVPVLFLDPVGREDESYIELMERNLEVFVDALGGK
ncbi:zinc ABC transporter substrate-binding protein [candidate division WOR-3 bacterium]|nr:zinc ABC transporter substrate-binding protein [candidate division WOR-3 bacterium]